MLDITVVILTKDEELHIERAIKNIAGWVKRVVVVDSGSRDRTVLIAAALGAEIYEHPFKNYSEQFQWALDNCDIKTQWVMRLDADEYLETDLISSLVEKIPTVGPEIVGVNFKRKHIFWGRWIRFGGRYPLILLRLWRSGFGRIEDRWMDEHIVVWGGSTITIEGGFCDENMNNLSFFTDKHNKYATREALDVVIEKYRLDKLDSALASSSSSFQASIKRTLKRMVYNKIPFQFSAFLYFLWRYFFQLGFLDGLAGIVYHFLQGFWYRFLVGAKVRELEMSIDFSQERELVLSDLSRATGHRVGGVHLN
ncbi:MAG: glycosyltransferase family 2 protein [Gammaproteobacteria bacterium]